jgi:UDP-N-acetylmuramyl pentapeptide phosphotransferase/UDP-N-acetylglucosamine-1-phosphate transferase
MTYIFYFALALVLALVLTPLVKRLAVRLRCIDKPGRERKIHTKPMPLMGGLAVFGAVAVCAAVYGLFGDWNFTAVPVRFAIGVRRMPKHFV